MKLFSILALSCIFCLVSMQSAFAGPSSGTAVQVKFATASAGAVNWTPVVTSTARGVKGISVMSTATLPLEIGIAYANAAANAEVRQMIVPAVLSSVGAPGAIYYPMSIGYGARVSIRALGSTGDTISTGEMDMSLFY